MKILMPIDDASFYGTIPVDNVLYNPQIILGGIERMSSLLCNTVFDDITIIPCITTIVDRLNKSRAKLVKQSIDFHKPDLILLHYPWKYTATLKNSKIPIIAFIHDDYSGKSCGGITMYTGLKKSLEMLQDGHHIAFLGEHQLSCYINHIHNKIDPNYLVNIEQTHIFRPAYCTNTTFNSQRIYDVMNVSRIQRIKNAFAPHEFVFDTTFTSLISTKRLPSRENDNLGKQNAKYENDNLNIKWKSYPNCITILNNTSEENFEYLRQAKTFMVAWTREPWGITALEALSCGVPLVVLTDESGINASDEIVADKSHSIKIVKTKDCKEQVINAIEVLSQYSTEKRLEIAKMTMERHSLDAWKRMFCDMFDKRMSSCVKPTQSLLKFVSH